MPLNIREGETVLFIGDSITDCGRRGAAAPLGEGYVKMFCEMMTLREPRKAARVRVINKGIGGDNVLGLQGRWTDDVLRHKPDWLSVKIGINDLHGALRDPANGISPQVYEAAYDDILTRTKAKLPKCRMLLIDPFYLSVEKSRNSFRRTVLDTMPAYISVVHKMSRRYRTRLVKTHELFGGLLKDHEADEFCGEPVHPYRSGHLAIAEWAYKALSK